MSKMIQRISLRFDKLKFLAEGVKKSLSTSGEFLLRDTSLQDKEGAPVIIDTMFERPEVEEIINPIVERTIPYCFDALEKAEQKSGVRLADVGRHHSGRGLDPHATSPGDGPPEPLHQR